MCLMPDNRLFEIVKLVLKIVKLVSSLRELCYRLFLIQYDCKRYISFVKSCIVKYVCGYRGVVSDKFILWSCDVCLQDLYNILEKLHDEGYLWLIEDDYSRTKIVASDKLVYSDIKLDNDMYKFAIYRIRKYMYYDFIELRKLILFKFLNVRRLLLVTKYDIIDLASFVELEKYNGYKYDDFIRERGMKLKIIALRQLFQ